MGGRLPLQVALAPSGAPQALTARAAPNNASDSLGIANVAEKSASRWSVLGGLGLVAQARFSQCFHFPHIWAVWEIGDRTMTVAFVPTNTDSLGRKKVTLKL